MNYLIILFKNKTQRKILKRFNTLNRARSFFKKKVDDNKSVVFNKIVQNGKYCKYEIGIVAVKHKTQTILYKRDNIGRNVKVELDSPTREIIELVDYMIPEKIYDISTKKKISLDDMIKTYIPKVGMKLISKLNHKIAIQSESKINLFSLKSEAESERLMGILTGIFRSAGRMDILLVRDYSTQQRKSLYELLVAAGYSKQTLYRKFTTHPIRK